MNALWPDPTRSRSSAISLAEGWDASVLHHDGHLLQSWRWGEFKARHGWETERIAATNDGSGAVAQVLIRRRGPIAIAYIPRGPAFAQDDVDALRRLFRLIDEMNRERKTAQLIVEPDRPLSFRGTYRGEGFVRGPDHIQPGRTVVVPLLEDDALLAQMHQKTRYSVRLAERRGVEIRAGTAADADVSRFYGLLADTANRNAFGIHAHGYYADFLETFGDDALLLFAYVGDHVAASLIAAKFGPKAVYMYGASSTEHRAHGSTFALQFHAMRWARDAGCTEYDLWGIPATDPVATSVEGGRVPGTKGEDWRGLHKFKIGFGGRIVSYPPTLERRYRPALALLARRLLASRG